MMRASAIMPTSCHDSYLRMVRSRHDRVLAEQVSTHPWLHLPPPWRATDFAAQLLAHGVRVIESEVFAVGRGEIPLQGASMSAPRARASNWRRGCASSSIPCSGRLGLCPRASQLRSKWRTHPTAKSSVGPSLRVRPRPPGRNTRGRDRTHGLRSD